MTAQSEDSLVKVMADAIWDECSKREVESIPGAYVPKSAWPLIAHACLAALRAQGYAIVPREPTEAMLSAAKFAGPDRREPDGTTESVWAAMLAAAEEGLGNA